MITPTSNRKQRPKESSLDMYNGSKIDEHILHNRHVSSPGSSRLVDHKVALTHCLPLQNHGTIAETFPLIFSSHVGCMKCKKCVDVPASFCHNVVHK